MCDVEVELTEDEIKILELLGRLHVSQHKNINEATIRKKLPQQYHINLNKTIKSRICIDVLGWLCKWDYSIEIVKKVAKSKYSNQ